MLFANNGRCVSNEQADEIFASTGGRVIGIRTLLLAGEESYSTKLNARFLETFLKAHVWEKWDKQTREYMKKTSVAEELTPDLFSALTGEKKGAEALAAPVRENTFLRPAGERKYRAC